MVKGRNKSLEIQVQRMTSCPVEQRGHRKPVDNRKRATYEEVNTTSYSLT